MLLLSRKKGETIVINNDITITVCKIRSGKVSLGFVAPKDVPVRRQEVQDAIDGKTQTPSQGPALIEKALAPVATGT